MSKSTQRIKTIAKKGSCRVCERLADYCCHNYYSNSYVFCVLFIVFPVLLESEAAELDNKVVNIEIQSNQYPMYLIESFNESYTKLTYVNATFNDSLSLPLSDLDRVRNMEIDAILRLNYTNDIWYYSVIHLSTSKVLPKQKIELFLHS